MCMTHKQERTMFVNSHMEAGATQKQQLTMFMTQRQELTMLLTHRDRSSPCL